MTEPFVLPDGVQTWVPGTDTENCIKMALREGAHDYPQEATAMVNYIKNRKANLHHASGMSQDGSMRIKVEIPAKLAFIIQRMTHKDWLHDQKILKILCREAPGLVPAESVKIHI